MRDPLPVIISFLIAVILVLVVLMLLGVLNVPAG